MAARAGSSILVLVTPGAPLGDLPAALAVLDSAACEVAGVSRTTLLDVLVNLGDLEGEALTAELLHADDGANADVGDGEERATVDGCVRVHS